MDKMTKLKTCLENYYNADLNNDSAKKKVYRKKIHKYSKKRVMMEAERLSENANSLLYECWLKSISFIGVLSEK